MAVAKPIPVTPKQHIPYILLCFALVNTISLLSAHASWRITSQSIKNDSHTLVLSQSSAPLFYIYIYIIFYGTTSIPAKELLCSFVKKYYKSHSLLSASIHCKSLRTMKRLFLIYMPMTALNFLTSLTVIRKISGKKLCNFTSGIARRILAINLTVSRLSTGLSILQS